MSWPPTIGELLPRAGDVYGIDRKLVAYCLNLDHEVGGPKAHRFEQILGIGSADVEHLAGALRSGPDSRGEDCMGSATRRGSPRLVTAYIDG